MVEIMWHIDAQAIVTQDPHQLIIINNRWDLFECFLFGSWFDLLAHRTVLVLEFTIRHS